MSHFASESLRKFVTSKITHLGNGSIWKRDTSKQDKLENVSLQKLVTSGMNYIGKGSLRTWGTSKPGQLEKYVTSKIGHYWNEPPRKWSTLIMMHFEKALKWPFLVLVNFAVSIFQKDLFPKERIFWLIDFEVTHFSKWSFFAQEFYNKTISNNFSQEIC